MREWSWEGYFFFRSNCYEFGIFGLYSDFIFCNFDVFVGVLFVYLYLISCSDIDDSNNNS